jgi:hypothetical protein
MHFFLHFLFTFPNTAVFMLKKRLSHKS